MARMGKVSAGIAMVALAILSGSCAARSYYRQGQSEARKGNWDMAVARLSLAIQKEPKNIDFKIALENAKVQASRHHYEEARKAIAATDLDKAAEELEIATKYDIANKAASEDLRIVRDRIEKREEEKRRLQDYDAMKARAQAKPLPLPVLSPRSPVPITIKFTDASLEKVLDTLSKLSGVNILLDASFKDKRTSVSLQNVTFEQALDEITLLNQLFFKVIDSNTLIVAADTTTVRRHYDDTIVRSFYLQNADLTEINNLLTKLIVSPSLKIAANPTLQALTVKGTPDEVALVARVIELNDKPRGEVMVEVEILEVERQKLKDYGLALSQYQVNTTFNPLGSTAANTSGFTSVQPQVLSSLNVSDFVVSIPSTVFAKFMQNESDVKILASPRLRAGEGELTKLNVVTQVPVPTTTFQSTNTGGATFTPVTTTVYKDVGVKMELTPKINPNGDISLKMTAEFSLQGQSVTINGTSFPEFLTRTVQGTVRVKDGEPALIGGLIQGREATTLAGILGLQNIPILKNLFNETTKEKDETEILISLTPHLVRAPKLTEGDLQSLAVGTQELIRVPSAHPPLFGPPETPPSPSIVVPVAGSPLPAPTPQPQVSAPPAAAPSPPVRSSGVTLQWSPAVVSGKAGDILSLNVVALGVQDVLGVELTLTFDKTALEATDLVPGSLLAVDGASIGVEHSLEPGRAHAHFKRATGASGSGAVATLRFKGLHSGTAGVALQSLSLTTAAGVEVPSLPAPGSAELRP
jgi:general secretion pathway protein D